MSLNPPCWRVGSAGVDAGPVALGVEERGRGLGDLLGGICVGGADRMKMAPEDNRDGTTVNATLATWDMLRLGTIAGLSQRPDARLHRAFVVS